MKEYNKKQVCSSFFFKVSRLFISCFCLPCFRIVLFLVFFWWIFLWRVLFKHTFSAERQGYAGTYLCFLNLILMNWSTSFLNCCLSNFKWSIGKPIWLVGPILFQIPFLNIRFWLSLIVALFPALLWLFIYAQPFTFCEPKGSYFFQLEITLFNIKSDSLQYILLKTYAEILLTCYYFPYSLYQRHHLLFYRFSNSQH